MAYRLFPCRLEGKLVLRSRRRGVVLGRAAPTNPRTKSAKWALGSWQQHRRFHERVWPRSHEPDDLVGAALRPVTGLDQALDDGRVLDAKLEHLVDKGMRKPRRRTFDDLADEFEDVALAARPRKKSTVVDYKATLRNHLADIRQPRSRTAVAVTRGVRAVRGREDRGRPFAEVGAKPPDPRRADVPDGAAVAVGERQPARPCGQASSRRRRDGDDGRGDDRRSTRRLPGARADATTTSGSGSSRPAG